ncbi:hypothetical protein HRI96_00670 [Treponema parvum]|uniref:Uncharacterized protein n=1 Tax=Treponema parvum TaxID=138851 RepID=A0A975EXH7_9SPIR|nr:hypothetical protein [Treponema parvum]QTQ10835.1 hypothetical protein HRI96_00670 [Treponema parvum]
MIHKILRFFYLNTYGFICLALGFIFIAVPLWTFSKFWLIPQGILSLIAFIFAYNLLGMWKDKIREYMILIERNKNEFRPDTFKIFMDAPCGRKITKAVLKDLGKPEEYKNLLIYKPKLKNLARDLC